MSQLTQKSKRKRSETIGKSNLTSKPILNSINRPLTKSNSDHLTLKLSHENNKGNHIGPALVKFPDVIPPPTTQFLIYGHKTDEKAHKIIAGETPVLEYESIKDDQISKDNTSTYLIGLQSSSSQTLTLFPTTLHQLRTNVKSLKSALSDLKKEEDESVDTKAYQHSRISLGTTFGTKKVRRAIQAAARNQIDPESMLHLQGHLLDSIASTSTALPTLAQQVAEADAQRPIPPYQLNAKSPKEIYQLKDIISNLELHSIPISSITSSISAQDAIQNLPHPKSSFVNQRIKSYWNRFPDGNLNKKEEKRLRILIYINYLIKLHSNRKWNKDHLKRLLTVRDNVPLECPDLIIDGLLRRFTEKAQGSDEHQMTTLTTTKLLCYLAVLCLIHDEFTCPTTELAEDLQEDTKRLHEIFRTVGCKIDKRSSSELTVLIESAQKDGIIKNPASFFEKQRLAKLVVPLVFPQPRRKRQKN